MVLLLRLTALALLVLPVAACGADDGAGSDAGGVNDPSGITYVVTEVTDDGATKDLVPGSEARIAFTDKMMTITAGCNTMTGSYTVTGSTLKAGPLAMTQMACDPALMDQDQWLAGLFEKPVKLTTHKAGATITSGDVVLTLVDRPVASPDRTLERTRWELSSLRTADAVSSVPAGVTAWIEFDAGGAFQLHDGCNRGRGKAEVSATTLTFGPIASTRMACPGSEDVQQAFARVLQGLTSYAIEEDRLTITRGTEGLEFTGRSE